MKVCPYQNYYCNQAGGAIGAIYKGASYQKGCGVGSFLSGVFKTVFPLLKRGLKALGSEFFKTGASVVEDLDNNVGFRESFKNRISEAGKNLKRKAVNTVNKMAGDGYKRRRTLDKTIKRSRKVKARRTSINPNDIFK